MRRLPIATALVALAFGATSATTTVIDLAGYPSPVRLQADGGAAQDQAAGAVAVADLNGDGVDDLVCWVRVMPTRTAASTQARPLSSMVAAARKAPCF